PSKPETEPSPILSPEREVATHAGPPGPGRPGPAAELSDGSRSSRCPLARRVEGPKRSERGGGATDLHVELPLDQGALGVHRRGEAGQALIGSDVTQAG